MYSGKITRTAEERGGGERGEGGERERDAADGILKLRVVTQFKRRLFFVADRSSDRSTDRRSIDTKMAICRENTERTDSTPYNTLLYGLFGRI